MLTIKRLANIQTPICVNRSRRLVLSLKYLKPKSQLIQRLIGSDPTNPSQTFKATVPRINGSYRIISSNSLQVLAKIRPRLLLRLLLHSAAIIRCTMRRSLYRHMRNPLPSMKMILPYPWIKANQESEMDSKRSKTNLLLNQENLQRDLLRDQISLWYLAEIMLR